MTNTGNRNEVAEITAQPSSKAVAPKPKNALVHGVNSADLVLPWESEEELERLHKELVAEWSPQGRMEKETVLGLTRLIWLKHRVMRSTQLAAYKETMVIELEASGAKTWSEVMDFLKAKALADDGVMEEARKTLEELKIALKNASGMMTAEDRDTHKIYRAIETIEELHRKHVMPVYGKAFEKAYGKNYDSNKRGDTAAMEPAAPIEDPYYPSYLEKIVRLEASLDARIDKTIYRLNVLKEIKRLAKSTLPKLIESPPIAGGAVQPA